MAEKVVHCRELEEKVIRQEPGGRPVSEVGLAFATARLNSRLRLPGLSSRELWTKHNQFTPEQLPLSDYQLILAKHRSPRTPAVSSQTCTPLLQVGDIVYLVSDKDKSRARDRYIVVSVDSPRCFVKKFSGSLVVSYKVKLSGCYTVPPYSVQPSRSSSPSRQGRRAVTCNPRGVSNPSTSTPRTTPSRASRAYHRALILTRSDSLP